MHAPINVMPHYPYYGTSGGGGGDGGFDMAISQHPLLGVYSSRQLPPKSCSPTVGNIHVATQ